MGLLNRKRLRKKKSLRYFFSEYSFLAAVIFG